MSRRRDRQGGKGPNQPSEPGIKEILGPEMTVVARDARLEGTLVSAESIRIDGQAKGKIAARGDVILSSDSHVEADIQAQNVATAGTLKGSITARTMTEVEGGRVEGTIRSKALVVREGALFSGKASIDLQDAPGGVDGSAYQPDELQVGYDESVRRAAEWYRSTLYGRKAEPDLGSVKDSDATGISEAEETTSDLGDEARPRQARPWASQRIGGRGEALTSLNRMSRPRSGSGSSCSSLETEPSDGSASERVTLPSYRR